MLRKRKRESDEVFTSLENEIEQIFEDGFHSMWDLKNKRLEPLVYINETKDKVVITADLPLVKKKDITMNIHDDVLEISASMQRCVKFSKWGTSQKHCEFESFFKIVRLPLGIDVDKAKAKFEKGILSIEIPKKTKQYKLEII